MSSRQSVWTAAEQLLANWPRLSLLIEFEAGSSRTDDRWVYTIGDGEEGSLELEFVFAREADNKPFTLVLVETLDQTKMKWVSSPNEVTPTDAEKVRYLNEIREYMIKVGVRPDTVMEWS